MTGSVSIVIIIVSRPNDDCRTIATDRNRITGIIQIRFATNIGTKLRPGLSIPTVDTYVSCSGVATTVTSGHPDCDDIAIPTERDDAAITIPPQLAFNGIPKLQQRLAILPKYFHPPHIITVAIVSARSHSNCGTIAAHRNSLTQQII